MARKAISPRVRFEVLKRDGFCCHYCGGRPPRVRLTMDHIVAVANGGTNEEDNLITACADCNMGKSAVPIDGVDDPYESIVVLSDAFRMVGEWVATWVPGDLPDLAYDQYTWIMVRVMGHARFSGPYVDRVDLNAWRPVD